MEKINFVDNSIIKNCKYESYPFNHVVIDNFLKQDKLPILLKDINNLQDIKADSFFINPRSKNEFNKFAFEKNIGDNLKQLFKELNSPCFIEYLEKLTGIKGLIRNG